VTPPVTTPRTPDASMTKATPCNGGQLIRSGSGYVCDCSGTGQNGAFCDGIAVHDDDAGTTIDAPAHELALSVATYSYTTCALMANHTVRCWGDNSSGNVGDGTRTVRPTAVSVKDLDHVKQLDVGLQHACAVIDDGSLRCWGNNYGNMLLDGTNNNRSTPVVAMDIQDVVQVTIGESQSCVRYSNDRLHCWMPAPRAGLLDGEGSAGVVDVKAGYFITAAWAADGSVRTWGDQSLVGIDAPGHVKRVATGYAHICVLIDDGTVRCRGDNSQGQVASGTAQANGQVSELSGVIDLTAGFEHTCALLGDGTLRCWGQNEVGQLGDGTQNDGFTPSVVKGLDHVVEVTCGREHSCARRDDGAVYCWGGNDKGQLGDGSMDDSSVPVAVRGL
jgi:alpha-tubulin suppressor-like RCC1 family protein